MTGQDVTGQDVTRQALWTGWDGTGCDRTECDGTECDGTGCDGTGFVKKLGCSVTKNYVLYLLTGICIFTNNYCGNEVA